MTLRRAFFSATLAATLATLPLSSVAYAQGDLEEAPEASEDAIAEPDVDGPSDDAVGEDEPDDAPLPTTEAAPMAQSEPVADEDGGEDGEEDGEDVSTRGADELDAITEDAAFDAGPYQPIRGGILISAPGSTWDLTMGGYMRVRYSAIEDDPQVGLFGRNDGFVLSSARPYFAGRMANGLGFRLQFELEGVLAAANTNTPFREAVSRPRDVYVSYRPYSFLELQLGQFKAPFDLEALLSTQDILFARRSVGSRGVSPFAGRRDPINGLSIGREVGAQLTGRWHPGQPAGSTEGLGLSYALAVTNGIEANLTYNDNDALAYYGRAAVHWGEMVQLGGAAYLNDATLLDEDSDEAINSTITGLTADLLVRVEGATLFANVVQRSEQLALDFGAGNPTVTVSRAFQAQLGYEIPVVHLQPAYRFAFYDPTAEYNATDDGGAGNEVREIDALTYHTIGLNYLSPDYPVQAMVNYTITQEQAERTLANDRFDVIVQLTF
jgi:hypothetical protein